MKKENKPDKRAFLAFSQPHKHNGGLSPSSGFQQLVNTAEMGRRMQARGVIFTAISAAPAYRISAIDCSTMESVFGTALASRAVGDGQAAAEGRGQHNLCPTGPCNSALSSSFPISYPGPLDRKLSHNGCQSNPVRSATCIGR